MAKDDQRKSVEQLEQALAQEASTAAALRSNLEQLQTKVAALEASFEKRLAETSRRHEAKLQDQQDRLNALGAGREETMRALHQARTELARVAVERDQLQQQLTRIDGMQTETIALGEESIVEPAIHTSLPSLEELMASLSSMEEGSAEHNGGGFTWQPAADAESEGEMLPAALIFTKDDEESSEAAGARGGRVLVYLDAHPPIKYPLYKQLITIGRSATADIQVDDDFISRIHARLVCDEFGVIVEDAGSKNGIKVNAMPVARQSLKHGDVIGLGKLRFTFIDIDIDSGD
jgi:hypothetical protein